VKARLCYRGKMAVILSGFVYFVIIFAFAFAMGIARALFVTRWIGETAAVSLEIPAVLIASWFVAHHLVGKRVFSFPQSVWIGAIAFALTMVSEAALAGVIRGQSLAQWATVLVTPLGLFGLGGQLVFALIPTAAVGIKMNFWKKP
jgi:hypothetical protein